MYTKGEFCNYLLSFKVEKGCEFTHTSIVKPSGAFYIPNEEQDEFYDRYKTALSNGEELFLTERHKNIGPIVIDLDFRFEKTDRVVRTYTKETIDGILKVYISAFKEFFELKNAFHLYVIEKPHPVVDKGVIKDGIHIVVPDLISKPSVQYLIRRDVLSKIGGVLGELGLKNSYEDVIDEAVIFRNNWQMYGSKKPNCDTYKVTGVYRFDPHSESLTEEPLVADAEYVEVLSIRNKYDDTAIKPENKEKIDAFQDELKQQAKRMTDARLSKLNTKKNTCDNIEFVGKLVDILGIHRADKYDEWIRLGWCLRNIDHRLLDKWVEFSRKSAKFVDGECEKIWNLMRDDGLGIGTLHMWAKQDNPEEYKKILERDLANLIYRSRSETHYDISRVVHFMFKYDYVCISIKHNAWYEFKNHHWVNCDSGHSLRARISTDVVREYSAAAAYYNNKAAQEDMEADQQRYLEDAKKLNSIALKLKQSPFKDNIIKECRELFYIEKFEEKLDSRCHLIGFDNGVYDLEADEFREGRPEDYISFTTGNNFVEYDEDHPCMKDVNGFLSKVFTKEDIRNYVMKVLASFMNGNIREERFHIWTGTGCFAENTPIMMDDGSSKAVQDVQVGDQLMGDDSTPRKVLQLFRGFSDMYEIIPVKGEKFVVNGQHDLVVMASNMTFINNISQNKTKLFWVEYGGNNVLKLRAKTVAKDEFDTFLHKIQVSEASVKAGDVIILTVHQYNNLPLLVKERLNLYRPSFVEFPAKQVMVDPYCLGYWLGNGNKYQPSFTTQDQEVVDEFERVYGDTCKLSVYDDKGVAKTYGVSKKELGGKIDNEFSAGLKYYELYKNKHIPEEYKVNSKEVRQRILAGLVDSDGHHNVRSNNIEITLELENLIDDIMFIARSLGIACYKKKIQKKCHNNGKIGTYYRTILHGDNITQIPTVVPRKNVPERDTNRNPLVFSFKVKRIEDGNFFGFELDGNRRFLLGGGDFTVVKNSNGKSKIIELFESAFGDYCCKFPITLLTQKRAASNAATSELARAKGKRFACLQEPSEDEKLNIGLMKELTGGDKIMARALFKEPIEFKPQFKMILTCNHLPNVPSDDGGTWRRIRVVEFTSRFKENPDPRSENEFVADTELSQKFDDWKEHFMALLIKFYKKYKEEGMFEPEDVLKCTKEYQKNNDNYLEFCEQEIEKDERSFITVNDVYSKFGYWIKENAPHIKLTSKKLFVSAIDKILGKSIQCYKVQAWKGYRFKQDAAMAADDPLD